ncbi:AAA family ATPase [Rhodococcus baikonurensis]|uniref:AAA family ATPase n=1 Tax=Rhodococcus erythropolis group TaxID=2840174 RepID=UPI000BB34C8A|nr:zeta toxin family protein [Rhodococcus erythropolis]PBI88012.1 nucleoside triphosphate hydrolase domain-containing protein [Rhodococcus erythropolis]
MSSSEPEDRRVLLESLSTADGPLTIDAPHASVNDRRYFRRINGELVPTRERLRLHERILNEWRGSRKEVARDRTAILMAGPPGAGKSTAQHQLVGGALTRWRHLDADEFKLRLLGAAVADGSLQELLPEELRAAQGEPSRLYPNELCALVHVESNVILERAVAQSLTAGENVIIDGTMAWKPWVSGLVAQLDDTGYTIHVVDVEASREIAVARIVHRWQQGALAAFTAAATDSAAQMGGRWLPVSAVDRLFADSRLPDGKPLQGRSVSEINALEVSEESSAVTRYDLYRTLAVDRGPEHVERRERIDGGDLKRTWSARHIRHGELAGQVVDRESDRA